MDRTFDKTEGQRYSKRHAACCCPGTAGPMPPKHALTFWIYLVIRHKNPILTDCLEQGKRYPDGKNGLGYH